MTDGTPDGAAAGNKDGRGKVKLQVSLLDDTVVAFDVENKTKGGVLYTKVNEHLNLEESEYFGLQYVDSEGNVCWVDALKAMNKQVKDVSKVTFKFRVIFYAPDPNTLQEYTRYLFTLQVRRDLLDGRLHCSEDTGALLASFIVQGELGDFDPLSHKEGYLSGFQFVPNQTPQVEEKIIHYHKSHRGQTPSEADHNMLEVARQLEMYGMIPYPAKDAAGTELTLSVYHMGLLVFQDSHRINSFSWALIRKLSFKKKKLLIKLHYETNSNDVIEFTMKSRNACKGFWKVCIAHHSFFRQKTAEPPPRRRSFVSRGSKFRYSGRTQKQIFMDSRDRLPSADNDRSRASRTNPPDISLNGSRVAPSMVLSTSHGSPSPAATSSPAVTPSAASNNWSLHSSVATSVGQQDSSLQSSSQFSDDEGSATISAASPVYATQRVEMSPQAILNEERPPSDPATPSYPPTTTPNGRHSVGEYTTTTEVIEYHEEITVECEPDQAVHDNVSKAETSAVINHDAIDGGVDNDRNRHSDSEDESITRKIEKEYDSGKVGWQYQLTTALLDEDDDDERRESPVLTTKQNGNCNSLQNSAADIKDRGKDVMTTTIVTSTATPAESSANDSHEEGNVFDNMPLSRTSSVSSGRGESLDSRRAKSPAENIYYMAREILLTERTYVKDLEVLTVSFRSVLGKDQVLPSPLMSLLFDNVDPLYDFHCSLLAELEERLSMWDAKGVAGSKDGAQRIGDIMQRNMKQMILYTSFIQKHDQILVELEKEAKASKQFEKVYKEFELQKICYLPLIAFLLKPVQRLLYYRSILGRIVRELPRDHVDYKDAKSAFDDVAEACRNVGDSMRNLENLHKMVELERDLLGVESLVHPVREFIREGCLHKVCRKGPQPRMFFLFSDLLMYTSQGVTSTNQFRVRAQIPLHTIKVEEGGVQLHGLYSFTIYGGAGRSFVVAASSPEEKYKWMEDLQASVSKAKTKLQCPDCNAYRPDFISFLGKDVSLLCANCRASVAELAAMDTEQRSRFLNAQYPVPITIRKHTVDADSDDENQATSPDFMSSLDRRHAHSRTMSTRRVCWHRNTSISMSEYTISVQNNLSGELLRKLKNSNKWQKLWVVFTNFCLFFFKSYEDEAPLASLPLIGYTISRPSEADGVREEWALKVQFKTHVYFFRATSEYAFERWMEVLCSATRSASRSRIFSRLTSSND